MKKLNINTEYLTEKLLELLKIPSPSGYTDQIVHFIGDELTKMGVPVELTRRGAIRAVIKGKTPHPTRAVVAHVDTLGAMTKRLKNNGRLEVVPIGSWNARFAHGARVTIFKDKGLSRGTILPLKASGHVYNEEIDSQPSRWDNLEVRVNEHCYNIEDLKKNGFHVGDFIAIDPSPEVSENGYINSRHLDNKAGVATLLSAIKALKESNITPEVDCYILFTIAEEIGSGASAVLHSDVAEMVSIDNSTVAPHQKSTEYGVTIGMKDETGPFDYHLTHKLMELCEDHKIPFERDVFKYYRCDAASALEAGNDIRTALVCFGCDGSHGWERTHIHSLEALANLMVLYIQSPPTFIRDRQGLGPLEGFSRQPEAKFRQVQNEKTSDEA